MLKYLWPDISWEELNERVDWLAQESGEAFALKTPDDRYAITDSEDIVARMKAQGWQVVQTTTIPAKTALRKGSHATT